MGRKLQADRNWLSRWVENATGLHVRVHAFSIFDSRTQWIACMNVGDSTILPLADSQSGISLRDFWVSRQWQCAGLQYRLPFSKKCDVEQRLDTAQ